LAPGSTFVAPVAGSAPSKAGKVVTEILLANPDPNVAASVNLAFFPANGGAVEETTATVPPGGSAVVPYEDPALGFGALLVKASSPVSAVGRFANRTPAGDFAGAVPLLAAPSRDGRFLVSSDTRLRRSCFVFNRGVAGTFTIRTLGVDGSVLGVQAIPIGDHRSLILPNVGAAAGTSGGRIEFSGTEGTALYAWLAATDVVTGDSDAQSPLPITP
jgi:hypothetical protein